MRKLLAVAAALAAALALTAAPAAAEHVHSKQVGNGKCVLLAANGGEKNVNLPGDNFPDNVDHPIHRHVHRGRAGQNFPIGVYNTPSDPCFDLGPDAYVNARP